ncbi:MAG: hypothetical protein IPG67_03185 [Acidobacteria bacterium]|nr:hypothetical protein [Acidobacteriota bacterium]
MSLIKISITILAISMFLSACTSSQPQQTVSTDPIINNVPQNGDLDDYWAKDNLDLQRVGNLFERSNSPEEFESYLNANDGINNLDLNGDGYVDYIGVQEYQDRDDNSRGLSLFSRFGPDLIQEIAQIVLYRDSPNWSGARVLVRGNDQIYGDNNYYETNWADRTIGLVSMLFGNRTESYRSPYYYGNYPPQYQTYQVVDTPYYRTRIERLYPQPIFVYTANPVWISKIKIKSPNNGLHLGQIKARLVKPTKEQEEFYKVNPRVVKAVKADKDDNSDKKDKGGKDDDKGIKPDNDQKADPSKNDRKNETPGINPNQPSKPGKPDRPDSKPVKQDKDGKDNGKPNDGGKGKGKP